MSDETKGYGNFFYFSKEMEESFSSMSDEDLSIMASIITESAMDSYKEIVLKNLMKIKKEKS